MTSEALECPFIDMRFNFVHFNAPASTLLSHLQGKRGVKRENASAAPRSQSLSNINITLPAAAQLHKYSVWRHSGTVSEDVQRVKQQQLVMELLKEYYVSTCTKWTRRRKRMRMCIKKAPSSSVQHMRYWVPPLRRVSKKRMSSRSTSSVCTLLPAAVILVLLFPNHYQCLSWFTLLPLYLSLSLLLISRTRNIPRHLIDWRGGRANPKIALPAYF